jgi:hypothetical protein
LLCAVATALVDTELGDVFVGPGVATAAAIGCATEALLTPVAVEDGPGLDDALATVGTAVGGTGSPFATAVAAAKAARRASIAAWFAASAAALARVWAALAASIAT